MDTVVYRGIQGCRGNRAYRGAKGTGYTGDAEGYRGIQLGY